MARFRQPPNLAQRAWLTRTDLLYTLTSDDPAAWLAKRRERRQAA